MTTFSSSRRLLAGSGDDGPSPTRSEAGQRNLHRAEGWVIAFAGAAVLWGLIIGGASRLLSIVG